MLTKRKLAVISNQLMGILTQLTGNGYTVRFLKIWHFRHDWLFTPFVVVVGCKYFLPVPECLLFDQALKRR